MPEVGRESAFIPTVKCSSCGIEVPISLMGEHICELAPPLPTKPTPSPATSDDRNAQYGKPIPGRRPGRVPPELDTTALNRGHLLQGRVTPVSTSSGSRSVSPPTPGIRSLSSNDDFFAPSIASEYDQTSSPQSFRPGWYDGLGAQRSSYDDDMHQDSQSPKMATFMDRANNIARGPFQTRGTGSTTAVRAPSSPRRNLGNDQKGAGSMDRPGTAMSQASTGSSLMQLPRVSRKGGYGGFGPPAGRDPERRQNDFKRQPFERAGTFPKQNAPKEAPARTPSVPAQPPVHRREPGMDPDTGRKPPPPNLLTQQKDVPRIKLAREFEVGNPYDDSTTSVGGMNIYSPSSEQLSSPFSLGSITPPSTLHSFQQQPTLAVLGKDGAGFSDPAISDLQSSMDHVKPSDATRRNFGTETPYTSQGNDESHRRDNYGGLDRLQGPSPNEYYNPGQSASRNNYDRAPSRGDDYRSPQDASRRQPPLLPSAAFDAGSQSGKAAGRSHGSLPSPTFEPTLRKNDQRSRSTDRDATDRCRQDPYMYGNERNRDHFASERPRERSEEPNLHPNPPSSYPPPSTSTRFNSRAPRTNVDRGICRACGDPIRGKSICSADGRLTGKYHKACFVCTTCQDAFTTTTFYVHNDKPYCERHYHRANGSLCGKCKKGIEGEYLADEEGTKYHPNCFQCADCGLQLGDGYFDVSGTAYCEKDAWKRIQREHERELQRERAYSPHNPQPPAPGQWSRHERQRMAGLAGLSIGPKAGRSGIGLPPVGSMSGRLGMQGAPHAKPRLAKRMTRLGMI